MRAYKGAVTDGVIDISAYRGGHSVDAYKLDEEIVSLIHLLRLQVIPMNRSPESWVWEVKSCHSGWCIDIPGGATTADWKKYLADLIEARRDQS